MTDPNVPPVAPVEPAPVEPTPSEPEEEEDLDPGEPETPPAEETPEQLRARIQDLNERNGKLWGRIQRMKSKPAVPAAPTAPATPQQPSAPATPPSLTREEAIVIAKGYSLVELDQLKKVATLQNVDILKALEDPLFTGWKAQEDKKAKDAKAQLPPSRGARTTVKKTLATPGLSDAEHKELFQEKIGK